MQSILLGSWKREIQISEKTSIYAISEQRSVERGELKFLESNLSLYPTTTSFFFALFSYIYFSVAHLINSKLSGSFKADINNRVSRTI